MYELSSSKSKNDMINTLIKLYKGETNKHSKSQFLSTNTPTIAISNK
jgi:hypothetical protein